MSRVQLQALQNLRTIIAILIINARMLPLILLIQLHKEVVKRDSMLGLEKHQ